MLKGGAMARPWFLALVRERRAWWTRGLLAILGVLLLVCGEAAGAPSTRGESPAVGEASSASELRQPEAHSETAAPPYRLDGRSRFELRLGASDVWVSDDRRVEAVDVTGGAVSLVFLHWIDERLALEVSLGASNVGASSRETVGGEIVDADGFGSLMAGGRFYLPLRGAFRPHLGVAAGPLTDFEVRDRPWETEVTVRTTKIGLAFEAGVDFLVGGHFVLGIHGGAVSREGYYPQGSFGVNLGWAFGGRK
jgi:hypothetical protein